MRIADRGAAALYLALAAVALLELAAAVVPAVQRRFMAAHHARRMSLPAWVAVQATPKMYAYAHEAWFAREPITEFMLARPEGLPFAHDHVWLNHSPGRVTRMEGVRAAFAREQGELFVHLRSRYRGLTVTTDYRVFADRERGVLVVRRLEPRAR